MKRVTRDTTIGEISDWLKEHDVCLSVSRGKRGQWLVVLLGPRGAMRARGFSNDSWADAVDRAVLNYQVGVKP